MGGAAEYHCCVYLYAQLLLMAGRRPVTLSTELLRFFVLVKEGPNVFTFIPCFLQHSRVISSLHCKADAIILGA